MRFCTMNKFRITGIIAPTSKPLNLPSHKYQINVDGGEVLFTFSIESSKIDVDIETAISEENYPNMLMGLGEFINNFVSLMSFCDGTYRQVILEFFMTPDNIYHPLIMNHPDLSDISISFGFPDNFSDFMRVVLTNDHMRRVVQDLSRILGDTVDTVAICARSVEAVRNVVASDCAHRSDAWAIMRDRLNIDRSYIEYIMEAAKRPRHGHYYDWTGKSSEYTKYTWNIVCRCIQYLITGNNLDHQEFSLLKID